MKNIFKNFGIKTDNKSKNLSMPMSGTTQSLVNLANNPSGASVASTMRQSQGQLGRQSTPTIIKTPATIISRPDMSVRMPSGIVKPTPSIPRTPDAHILPIQSSKPAITPTRITGATTQTIPRLDRGILGKTFNPTPQEAQQRREGLVKAITPSSVGLVIGTRDKAWGIGIGVPPASVSQKLAEKRMEVTSFTKPVEAGRLMTFTASTNRKDAVGSSGMLESLRR